MVLYTNEQLEKMTLAQLKSAKKNFYKQTKRLGIPPSLDQLAYIIRLRAELFVRRV